jgi:hypothetical protein
MAEKHVYLWEAQPREPATGLPVLVQVRDQINPGRTHGVLVYLFEREEDARRFACSGWSIHYKQVGALDILSLRSVRQRQAANSVRDSGLRTKDRCQPGDGPLT